jgi:apolipoprotein N-acyltransferase
MIGNENRIGGFAAHLLTAFAISAAIYTDIAAFSYVAFVPWALALTRLSKVATFVATTLSGTCVGLVAFDFVVTSGPVERSWIWIPGSLLFAGLNWASCSLLARSLLILRVPLLPTMLFGWFLFDLNLRYSSRLFLDGGIPFLQLGAMQSQAGLVHLAGIGSLTLVGIAVITINWVLAESMAGIWNRQPRRLYATGLVGVVLGVGILLLAPQPIADTKPTTTIRVGISGEVIKKSPSRSRLVRPDERADLLVFGESSFQAGGLIVMPVNSPGAEDSETGPAHTLWQLAKESAVPFMVTAPRYWDVDGILAYHSAILVTPDSGVDQAYDKQYLAIELELRPRLLRGVDWICGKINLGPARAIGKKGSAFVLGKNGIRIGPTICYDLYFEKPFTEYIESDSESVDLLVNCACHRILDSRMDRLALRHARFRAIETGRPIVHVAIDGTSAVFDCQGRQVHRSRTPETMTYPELVDVPLETYSTIFRRVGRGAIDLFFGLSLTAGIWVSLRNSQFNQY